MSDRDELLKLLDYKDKMEKCVLSLLNISNTNNITEDEIIQLIINEVTDLTSSHCGYLHLFNSDSNTIDLKVWSENTLKHCTVVHDSHYPLESSGIWADCARLKRPVVHNDYENYKNKKGLPTWHFTLTRHMSVPVIENGKVVVIIGVGNKETDYDELDIKQMEVITQNLWRLIRNNRYEQKLKLDYLTVAFNRQEFEVKFQEIIEAKLEENTLAYIDLENFKIINDTSGHSAGDELLKQVSILLKTNINSNDILSRIGGDDFTIIFKNKNIENTIFKCNELIKEFENYKFTWNSKVYSINLNIGVVNIDCDKTIDYTLTCAELTCTMSRNSGKNKINVFSKMLTQNLKINKAAIASDIPYYIKSNKLKLFAQPINCITDNDCVCKIQKFKKISKCLNYEILLRLYDNDRYNPPGELLEAAENYNLSIDIDKFVISSVIEILKDIRYHNKVHLFFINLSSKSISNFDFFEFLVNEVKSVNFPHKLCFEITETVAINNYKNTLKLINTLRSIGCRFALDDFGSGFSSFGYLKDFPVDFIKIDGMFVKDLYMNNYSRVITKSINEISHSLKMKTIAEFVEDGESLKILKNLGVDFGQGYYFKKPHPVEDIIND